MVMHRRPLLGLFLRVVMIVVARTTRYELVRSKLRVIAEPVMADKVVSQERQKEKVLMTLNQKDRETSIPRPWVRILFEVILLSIVTLLVLSCNKLRGCSMKGDFI
jgi:hypothetical protein